jgi:hypothetical protein
VSDHLVDPQPLLAELARWQELHGLHVIAAHSGVSQRTLRRHLNGTSECIFRVRPPAP